MITSTLLKVIFIFKLNSIKKKENEDYHLDFTSDFPN